MEILRGRVQAIKERIDGVASRYVAPFDKTRRSLRKREILGAKGLGLVGLAGLESSGIQVPPGFTITTEAWKTFQLSSGEILPALDRQIKKNIQDLAKKTGTVFGDPDKPLTVSVRSGAAVSMPGAMETVLNVGINDENLLGLAQDIGTSAAYEAYFTLISDLASFERGSGLSKLFEDLQNHVLVEAGVSRLNQLPQETLEDLVSKALDFFRVGTGHEFPQDPYEQLNSAIFVVFNSWNNEVPRTYRKQHGISSTLGTAAIVQTMVYGNSENAGSGVLLTSDPVDLSPVPKISYVPNAQGTAVVGTGRHRTFDLGSFSAEIRPQIARIAATIESHYKVPQDVEFTIDEDQRVWVLQTRDANLSNIGSFRLALKSFHEDKISETDAVRDITTRQLQTILEPDLDPEAVKKAISTGGLLVSGQGISPGNANGSVVHTLDEARLKKDQKVVFIGKLERQDLIGLPSNVVGIVAENGGLGSHLARLAEQIGVNGLPVIFGAVGEKIRQGRIVTVDGVRGHVFKGRVPVEKNGEGSLLSHGELETARSWYKMRLSQPWRYITSEVGVSRFDDRARSSYRTAEKQYVSPKAREIAVLTDLVPREIRLDYTIVNPQDQEQVVRLLRDAVREGKDASIRTCHIPPFEGGGPWAQITSEDDIDKLFIDPRFSKYGNYDGITAERDGRTVTEVLVGKFPKGKLSEVPAIKREHCAWTLTLTQEGDVLLQIHPYSAQLRDHETIDADDVITVPLEPSYSNGKDSISMGMPKIGDNLTGTNNAHALAEVYMVTVTQHIIEWWEKYNLPKRLAAIQTVFPFEQFGTPVLQGQARVGNQSWCLIYDVNIDRKEYSPTP